MPKNLLAALRQRTADLHRQAERSGIIHDILHGAATRYSYALLLRNLFPAYRDMEKALDNHRGSPGILQIARVEVYRSAALEADLEALHGSTWPKALPLLPEADQYLQRIADASTGDGSRLIAHAYARYLGDLNGGRILKRLVSRGLGLEAQALNFYEFPRIDDLDAFKSDYREAIDKAADQIADIEAVVEESAEAFRLNINLSEAVQTASMNR